MYAVNLNLKISLLDLQTYNFGSLYYIDKRSEKHCQIIIHNLVGIII